MADYIHFKLKRSSFIFLTVLFFVGLLFVSNIDFHGFKSEILAGDARGYYAWLPAIFEYHSVDFQPVLEQQKARLGEHFQGHYYHELGDILINKFTCGVALLQAPFYLIFKQLSALFGQSTDAYSAISQWGICFAALFYAFIGFYFLRRLLLSLGFHKKTALIAMLAFLFGSNLFYYIFMHPGMSHVYSFSMVSVLFYAARMLFVSGKKRYILLLSITLGLIFLIRPFNVLIVLFLPFMANSPKVFLKTLKNNLRLGHVLFSVIPFLLIASIQMYIYYLQSGQLWIWAYQNEGFFFLDPQISNVLFSYRKGLFIYTPLTLISLIGIFVLIRRNTYQAIISFLFLAIIIWMVASWWNWYYGGGFGMRPFVDFYPVFIILLAVVLKSLRTTFFRYAFYGLLAVVVLFNALQTYQYSQGIIHPESMNKQKYWYVFLKTAKAYEHVLGDAPDDLFKQSPLKLIKSYLLDFDSTASEEWVVYKEKLYPSKNDSSNLYCRFDSISEYNASLIITDTSLLKYRNLLGQVQFAYSEIDTNSCMRAFFVASANDRNNVTVFYKSNRMKDMPNNRIGVWDTAFMEINVKYGKGIPNELRLYFWNKEKESFLIDDVKIDFYEVQEEVFKEQ